MTSSHVDPEVSEAGEQLKRCQSCTDFMLRSSEMAMDVCELVRGGVRQCAANCGQFQDDPEMQECAAACAECARICREVTNHG